MGKLRFILLLATILAISFFIIQQAEQSEALNGSYETATMTAAQGNTPAPSITAKAAPSEKAEISRPAAISQEGTITPKTAKTGSKRITAADRTISTASQMARRLKSAPYLS